MERDNNQRELACVKKSSIDVKIINHQKRTVKWRIEYQLFGWTCVHMGLVSRKLANFLLTGQDARKKLAFKAGLHGGGTMEKETCRLTETLPSREQNKIGNVSEGDYF